MWFLEHVWPELRRRLPSARFIIAGLNCWPQLIDQPPPERVVITGMVDDLTPFYNNARVFVAPTRASSGIPLKVIEAAGRGVPVVASSLLVSQLGWDSPREILQADRGPEFVEACVALYTEEASWRLQREAALARVAAEYSPAMLAQQLQRALNLPGS
jgi:glycosyltransferase involved in cell wall biosynthesis